MAQTLTVIAEKLDQGKGVTDIDGALAAATSVDLNFVNTGDLVLFVSNGDAAPKTATVKSVPDADGRGGSGVNDEATIVPAGKIGFIPFMSRQMFNTGGVCNVTLSATTSVKVGLYRLTKQR